MHLKSTLLALSVVAIASSSVHADPSSELDAADASKIIVVPGGGGGGGYPPYWYPPRYPGGYPPRYPGGYPPRYPGYPPILLGTTRNRPRTLEKRSDVDAEPATQSSDGTGTAEVMEDEGEQEKWVLDPYFGYRRVWMYRQPYGPWGFSRPFFPAEGPIQIQRDPVL